MSDLRQAAESGDVDRVRRVLHQGAPVNQLDDAEHLSTVALLLEFGANPNAAGDYAETVLIRAAAGRHLSRRSQRSQWQKTIPSTSRQTSVPFRVPSSSGTSDGSLTRGARWGFELTAPSSREGFFGAASAPALWSSSLAGAADP